MKFSTTFLAITSLAMLCLVGCGPSAESSTPSPFDSDTLLVDQSSVEHAGGVRQAASDDGDSQTRLPTTCDWPALFGSNRFSTTDVALDPWWPGEGPELVWETESGTGYGSPVSAQGRVVFNFRRDDNEYVRCHRADDGQLIWEHAYPTTAVCDFEYSNGPYSTPIIDVASGRVYNVGGQAQFQCLDFETGELIWERRLHEEYAVTADIFPVGASPILDRQSTLPLGQLIFNLGAEDAGAGILSLDCRDGKTLWTATDQGVSYGTPMMAVIHEQRFAFVLTAQGLVSLDPDSGKVDWSFPFRRTGDLTRNATSPLVTGDRVLLVASGPGAASLQVQPDRSFKKLWHHRRSLNSQYNTLILKDNAVYSFTSGGQGGADFCCLEIDSGKITWRYHSALKRGMGLATANRFVLFGEQGHLAALEASPEKPKLVAFTNQPLMQAPCYCSPALCNDLVVLKDEHRVAAFRATARRETAGSSSR